MMIHRDCSTHEWVAGLKWDLIVTMDDAASWHYSLFFMEEKGKWAIREKAPLKGPLAYIR